MTTNKLPTDRFERMVELANEGIWTLDADGLIDYVNERGASILGYAPEEMIGRSPRDFALPEQGRPESVPGAQGAAEKGRTDLRVCRKDGTIVWISSSTSQFLGEDGSYQGGLAVFDDITERKRAEEALAFQAHLLACVRDAVIASDENFIVTYWNERAERLFGWTAEEAVGRRLGTMLEVRVPGSTREAEIERMLEEGYYEGEAIFNHKDGHDIHVDVHVSVMRDRSGGAREFLYSFRDIGDRKRAEEALRKSEERHRYLVQYAPSAIFKLDFRDMRFKDVNEAMSELTGYTQDELLSMGPLDFLDKEDIERFKQGIRERLEDWKGSESVEYKVKVKGGRELWAVFTLKPIYENGRAVGALVIGQDDTEQRKMREALNESEERLRLHFQNSPLAVVEWDSDFVVTRWAGEAEKMFGYSADEVIGKQIMELNIIYPEDIPIVEGTMLELTNRLSDKVVSSNRNVTKDGRVIETIWYNSVLMDEEGTMTSVLSLILDNTARARAEADLIRNAEELARSNAELQQFAYVASHDLQEPLRMVSLYLDLLSRKFGGAMSPEAARYMGIALDGARRMRQLVNDLLEYSRVETKAREFKTVDMNVIACEVKDELHVAIDEAGAEVRLYPLPVVAADDMQMKQMLTNLVNNAIKFRGDRAPLIEISAVDGGDRWVFAVKDNGIGVDPRFQDKLFQMFQRLQSRDQYPGTGIGLAIAKKIVERYGGSIWVESDGMSGSTFLFTLPKS
jgi:PAS domain S-box-containing protein